MRTLDQEIARFAYLASWSHCSGYKRARRYLVEMLGALVALRVE